MTIVLTAAYEDTYPVQSHDKHKENITRKEIKEHCFLWKTRKQESGEDLEVAREVSDRIHDEPAWIPGRMTSSSLPSYLKERHILQFLCKNLIQWKKAPYSKKKKKKMWGNSLFLKLQKVIKKYHVG